MKKPTDVGKNRTGAATDPAEAKRTMEGAELGTPDENVDMEAPELHATRVAWSADAEPIGTMPPPDTMKGKAKAAVKKMQGKDPAVFLDQLGARLAFERTGTRLYEALLVKLAAANVHEGGPTRAELEEIRDEELRHAALIQRCMEQLGADPTAVTPAADIQGVASSGVMQVVADPRTTLTQALEAALIAELADNDSWQMLIELAEGLGQDEMAEQFRHALDHEERHLARVRRWLSAALVGQAGIEPAPRQDEAARPDR